MLRMKGPEHQMKELQLTHVCFTCGPVTTVSARPSALSQAATQPTQPTVHRSFHITQRGEYSDDRRPCYAKELNHPQWESIDCSDYRHGVLHRKRLTCKDSFSSSLIMWSSVEADDEPFSVIFYSHVTFCVFSGSSEASVMKKAAEEWPIIIIIIIVIIPLRPPVMCCGDVLAACSPTDWFSVWRKKQGLPHAAGWSGPQTTTLWQLQRVCGTTAVMEVWFKTRERGFLSRLIPLTSSDVYSVHTLLNMSGVGGDVVDVALW